MITKQQEFLDDLESVFYTQGHAQGRAEGQTEGRVEGLLDVARASLVQGLDETMVARITGLPLEQVKALRNN